MSSKIKGLTIFPAFIFFYVAAFLSFLTMMSLDNPVSKQQFWNWAFISFIIGLGLTCCWSIYWGLYKKFTR